MTDWRKLAIQAFPSILASGLIISAFNILYNDFFNKPVINTQFDSKEDKHQTEITITNNGRMPATHFLLTIETPENMTKDSPHIFTTVNITNVTKLTPRILKISVASFVHGSGSIIKIDLSVAEKPNKDSYTIYATYDQGSIKNLSQESISASEGFVEFLNTYQIPLILIVAGIVFAIIALFTIFAPFVMLLKSGLAIYKIFRRRYKGISIRSISDVLDDLLLVRHHLKNELLCEDILEGEWYYTRDDIKRRVFRNNIREYLIVDSFYKILKVRNSFIPLKLPLEYETEPVRIESSLLDRLNKECLDLCENVLNDIDWTK